MHTLLGLYASAGGTAVSVYPNVRWEWTMANPALFVAQGGIGRIRVYGIQDFDYMTSGIAMPHCWWIWGTPSSPSLNAWAIRWR